MTPDELVMWIVEAVNLGAEGAAAGQTVRRTSDVPDREGGVRGVIPHKEKYMATDHADKQQIDLKSVLERLVNALIDAESNRGVFSTSDMHDLRCPKGRAELPEDWRGEWVCECGREELDAALAEALRALGRE